jgi:predicted transcriptional regulator
MLTAEQIATKLKLDVYVVRYRLAVLRREGLIQAEKYGNTYIYHPDVVRCVRRYGAN